ncbi:MULTISPECIES: TatD family hydrolase [unclassified Halomonas]|jgi:TatD DNase family protein|uniref:TatD family hydrolase n=1 Tax=unclassified Halomonas TaxID=2609666 RepID=UPI00111A1272|nr:MULTISPECIES: TatD family hydrolase [unclassified Halomonas]MCG7575537.1 TatD family hydrolase [Halomonas sp. MMH1-48]MCG7589026.1 TatD family hydrolase [Halomonas sp. McD50-5]MCG7602599.1 TatD family hydrolase [Halomonas sp. MM17-34]MCG7611643.1 TatD family hydrolase [Halomonas sp. MM17-29]MCG7615187.1 TatD family hydrolase [Halomonas sp. McD50-4]
MFVDSHCHLDRLSEHTHGGDVAATLAAARQANVSQFLAISTTLEELPGLAAIAREHPDVAISAGLHPLYQAAHEPSVDEIVEAAEQYGAVAIGETGLDYHYQESVPLSVQHERFKRHLMAASELELPVIIHTREAKDDTLALLREHSNPQVGGVIHCFTEDLEMAREAVRLGFYISLSGIITFRNAVSLRTLARQLPLDRLLIETDSPYLAPVPHRGKPNEPAWVVEVAECIARERGISVDEVAMQTTVNFYHLFRAAVPDAPAHVKEALARSGLVV